MFWAAYGGGDGLDAAAGALNDYFDAMAGARDGLHALPSAGLRAELDPWAAKLGLYGHAGRQAVAMLLARRGGDEAAAGRQRAALDATRAQLAALPPRQVCVNVCGPFLDAAAAKAAA